MASDSISAKRDWQYVMNTKTIDSTSTLDFFDITGYRDVGRIEESSWVESADPGFAINQKSLTIERALYDA